MEAKVVTASAAHWEIVVYWRWEYMGFWSMRFHDLRHTCATMAISNGVNVETFSSMLCRYSAYFALDTYTHVTIDPLRTKLDKTHGTPGKKSCSLGIYFFQQNNFPIFYVGRRITSKYSSHLYGIQLRIFQNYFCFRHHDSKNPRFLHA